METRVQDSEGKLQDKERGYLLLQRQGESDLYAAERKAEDEVLQTRERMETALRLQHQETVVLHTHTLTHTT